MNGFIKRGRAAGESDIQHRADIHGAAFPFSVVEAEPAITARFAEWIHPTAPTAAPLISTGRSLHDGLHAVEGWRAGEVHFDRSFFVKWKKPEVFCKTSGLENAKRRTSFGLSAVCEYSVVREFDTAPKGKTAVLHLQICISKSRHLGSKKPR